MLLLLNRQNGYSITCFEYFFFKLMKLIDNDIIDIYTKRYIFKFLKYFTIKKKFTDIVITKINFLYSKLKEKKKKNMSYANNKRN